MEFISLEYQNFDNWLSISQANIPIEKFLFAKDLHKKVFQVLQELMNDYNQICPCFVYIGILDRQHSNKNVNYSKEFSNVKKCQYFDRVWKIGIYTCIFFQL